MVNWVRKLVSPLSLLPSKWAAHLKSEPRKFKKPILSAFFHSMLVWFRFWLVGWLVFGKEKYVRKKLSHYLQIKHGKEEKRVHKCKCLVTFLIILWFCKLTGEGLIHSTYWVSWRTLKVVREKVNWFLSSRTMRHEVSMVVFLDNCILLPAALHFDSHFHSCFHEQQKYSLFFSLSLC